MDTLAYNLKIIIYFVIIILLYLKGDLNNMLQWWVCLLIGIGCLVVGFVIGFFVIRAVFTKQLKKNPPINRDMIRAMFMQMGRKPSEKDITRVMNSMNQYK